MSAFAANRVIQDVQAIYRACPSVNVVNGVFGALQECHYWINTASRTLLDSAASSVAA